MAEKIKFKDRTDLIDQLVIKKKDIPESGKVIDSLVNSLKSYKRGDKDAMRQILKLRKKVFAANAELYIELDETGMNDLMVAQLNVLNLVDDDDDE